MIGFGVLLGAVVWMAVIALRRGKRRTENADGLLIEQVRTAQARADRSSYRSDEAVLASMLRDKYKP
ncbi:hypothetical protein EF912_14490 [Streptomyces sp. WAC07061]|nr:hypothetical protein EF912_14490 [Streptomyces sp. WAC07061]